MNYAEVAVNAPVNSTFHYHIPPELEGLLRSGHLVRVGFGTAMQAAIVLALHDSSPIEITKPVIELLDSMPVVDQYQIELARWMSDRYLAPLGQCLWLMLPPGMVGQRDTRLTLLDETAQPADVTQAEVIAVLRKRSPQRGSQVRRRIRDKRLPRALDALAESGIIQKESILAPPRVKPKVVQMAALAIHPDRIRDIMRYLGKNNRDADLLETIATLTDEQDMPPMVPDLLDIPDLGKRTLEKLVDAGLVCIDDDMNVLLNITPEELDQQLFELRAGQIDLHILQVLARDGGAVDVSWIYAQTGAKLDDLKRLAERELIELGEKQTWRDSLAAKTFVPMSAPRLTQGQRQVWQAIRARLEGEGDIEETSSSPIFLLHGVTGSGKTEIYLRGIEKVLAQGKQAIFLVPEIALTAQTLRRVAARFPGKVAIVHGSLSDGERYDTWQRARAGEIGVVVGARSALFTPLPDPALIILDEEHDLSYKQAPPIQPPYYDAREVAEQMARLRGGTVILGSATPDVESYFRSQRGEITALHLPDRIMGHRIRISEQVEQTGTSTRYHPDGESVDAVTIPLPQVDVVDMRAELRSGNTKMFSRALQAALAETLVKGEQAILFLNRRGASTYVFCRDCGYVSHCPRCDMPMTFHTYSGGMHCHHCGHQEPTPSVCPSCGSDRIKFFGAGTQQVEAALQQDFPDVRSLRWDADTAARPDDHDLILQRFSSGQADVLIGTQMIAKGLDLPMVTLVGVVSADMGLALPDFRASERTFQLLAQVAGRAGRGVLGGRVVLQTYQPDHYAVDAAARHDYAGFYAHEIENRRELGYPPFRRLVQVLIQQENAARARDEAHRAAEILRHRLEMLQMTGTSLIGPAPCFFGRVNRVYRWQVILRGPDPVRVFDNYDIPRYWTVDPTPMALL